MDKEHRAREFLVSSELQSLTENYEICKPSIPRPFTDFLNFEIASCIVV